jgi:hypothetical protein
VRQVLFSLGIVVFWALLIVPLVVVSDPYPRR